MKWDRKRKQLYFEGRAFSSSKAMCSYTILKGLCSLKTCGICCSFIRSNSHSHCHFHISSMTFRGNWERLKVITAATVRCFSMCGHTTTGFLPTELLSLTSNANQIRDLHVCLLLGNFGQNTKLHLNYRLKEYITYRYNISNYLSFSGNNWIHLESIK